MASARGRFPRADPYDRTLRPRRDPAGLLARRLAADLRGTGAVLRHGRIRNRRVRQGQQSAWPEGRRRQRVRGPAPARVSAAAVATGSIGDSVRSRGKEAWLSSVLNATRDHIAALQGASGLHLLHLLPGLWLLHRRQVE